MKEICFEKKIPIAGEYDVVVVGGGPAGWIAAVAAARSGARTAVIERYGFFGGAATTSLVVPISGMFKNGERVVGGIPWEFICRMKEMGAAQEEMPKGHISVDPEIYKLITQRMLIEAGVSLYTNSYLSDCMTDGKSVRAVRIENKSGSCAISGKVFIDATGDGDLCDLAGVPMMPADEFLQPMSMCFVLSGVDVTTPLLRDCIHHDGKGGRGSCNTEIRDYLNGLHADGRIPDFGGPWFNTLLLGDRIAVNITRSQAVAYDAASVTAAEIRMRENMFAIVEALREHYPEFKNAVISSSAAQGGVREGRHIMGDFLLTENDLLNAVHFSDSIARNSHPVDIHIPGSTAQTLKKVDRSGYIPYRTMTVPGFDDLIAAGRMICADRGAHASIRVQATVMAIGQAAGIAAAIAAAEDKSVREISISGLQEKLTDMGGIF
ncbi:MAG: FAD-dependent oxidoreductase [Clostridia bacterium]|nr:FAD-dependent oxidoreductase [Clostridia bacterium]